MENTNIVTAEQQAPNTISASNAIFNVQALGQLTAFANLMADSQVTVPAHLAGKPADCMAIVMQAMQWGMNPYAVAQKTHLVSRDNAQARSFHYWPLLPRACAGG